MPKRPTSSPDAAALRRRAEARVRATAARTPGPRTDADTQRLLHELQVRQVEFVLQNAELRQAREADEAGLARYTALYDLAPVAYLTLDRAGAIRSVNLTGATLLGLGRAAVGGTAFSRFLPADARPAFEAVLGTAFNDSGKHAVCEVPCSRPRGPCGSCALRPPRRRQATSAASCWWTSRTASGCSSRRSSPTSRPASSTWRPTKWTA